MRIIVHRGKSTTFTCNGSRMSMGKAYSAYRQGATFVVNGKVLSIDKYYTSHFGAPVVGKSPIAYFTYGRFQPGHKGHKEMIDHMRNPPSVAPGGKRNPDDVYVFTSETINNKRKTPCKVGEASGVPNCQNPLATSRKIEILRAQNPLVLPQNIQSKKTPWVAAYSLLDRYEKVVMYIGTDRVKGFQNMFIKNKDVSVEGVDRDDTGVSATKVRVAIVQVNELSVADKYYREVQDLLGLTKHPELLNVVITEIQAAYGLHILQTTRKRKISSI